MTASPRTASGMLPSGTVTFAFTDIEGSTQRWERGRAAMEDAVRRHDVLVREAIATNGGHVFKTIGDAFCAAFARPQDAVAAMLDAQRALALEDFSAVDGLNVRAAIHTGTADERDGDYFGAAVNRVARLLAIGYGGQTLVSGVTADLVLGDLPSQASLRDLGEHRLRDLTRPEQVYQLLSPDLARDFPPLRSLDALPNNLPRMRTAFVGREKELADITALIQTHSLVTLVGSGGVGKTRTSLQVAANLLDGSGDGVWFIELAPLAHGDYIASTAAQAMGLTLASDGDSAANLARTLKTKRALLVFDNCEHMVEPAARVISAILDGCPNIKVLASSRQGLGLAGEATYRMPSLALPSDAELAGLAPEGLLQYTAIVLFAERAREVDHRFEITAENAAVIVDICRRLDGIPLAIELAASRVKILSPRQLRERLHERFRVLTGGSRDVLPRQQTLRALIDWSHDLLDERERTLFRRLGIFVNGFSLDGASAVGAGAGLDELDVFDVLASLLDKSLVLAEPDGDSLRYRLLESTRAYAIEKLEDSGERRLIEARHLEYLRKRFVDISARAEQSGRTSELHDTLRAELEDVRAALDRAIARAEPSGAAELFAAIGSHGWLGAGLMREGAARAERMLAVLAPDELLLRSQISRTAARLLMLHGRKPEALEMAQKAVELARHSGDPSTLAEALLQHSIVCFLMDRPQPTLVDEAERIGSDSAHFRFDLMRNRAWVHSCQDDDEAAIRLFEQVYREQRALGNRHESFSSATHLAELYHACGQTARAVELTRENLQLMSATPAWSSPQRATMLSNLAGYLTALDEFAQAGEAAQTSIELTSRFDPDLNQVAVAAEQLAAVLALTGNANRAAVLEGFAVQTFTRTGFHREHNERTTHERLVKSLETTLSPTELSEYIAQGAALAAEDAIALALGARDS